MSEIKLQDSAPGASKNPNESSGGAASMVSKVTSIAISAAKHAVVGGVLMTSLWATYTFLTPKHDKQAAFKVLAEHCEDKIAALLSEDKELYEAVLRILPFRRLAPGSCDDVLVLLSVIAAEIISARCGLSNAASADASRQLFFHARRVATYIARMAEDVRSQLKLGSLMMIDFNQAVENLSQVCSSAVDNARIDARIQNDALANCWLSMTQEQKNVVLNRSRQFQQEQVKLKPVKHKRI